MTDRLTDICIPRAAFAAEKVNHIINQCTFDSVTFSGQKLVFIKIVNLFAFPHFIVCVLTLCIITM